MYKIKHKKYIFLILVTLGLFFKYGLSSLNINNNKINLETIYGSLTVTDPVIIDLINDPYMQRLKKVNQYGVDYYAYKPQNYNRYDHSIGVYFLAKKYGASIKEQIASLLHDVSHTAFSHVADYWKKKHNLQDSYQDDIHANFIENSSLKNILEKHGFKVSDILHKNKKFKILEQELPDICADRLEYNLYGGLLEEIINLEDIKLILDKLKFKNNKWYFTDINSAKKLADISLYLLINRWGGADNAVRNLIFADIINRAIDINLVTTSEIHNGFDDEIWNKFISSKDQVIKLNLEKLFNFKEHYVLDKNNYDICLKLKFRGINPLVKIKDKFIRLTDLDSEFKQSYDKIYQKILKRIYIKFK